MKPQHTNDRLAEQLRRDALAERPAFSTDLHRRLMRGIDARATHRPRWIPLAAAAAIAVIGGAVVAVRWHATAQGPKKTEISFIAGGGSPGSSGGTEKIGASAPGYQGTPALPPNFSLHLGGIASLQMSPTRVVLGPPSNSDALGPETAVADGAGVDDLLPPMPTVCGLLVHMTP